MERAKTQAASERSGYTVIELVVVMLMLGVIVAVALPRTITKSPRLQVDMAARALARDLEQVRMRAIASKRRVRVVFLESEGFYTAYMDVTGGRLGTISETSQEARASRLVARGSKGGVPGVELKNDVVFGAGDVVAGPLGSMVTDAITLEGDRVEFDAGGMVTPAGVGGVVFLAHEDEPSAVAAVTISGAGAFRAWRYRNGSWQK